MTSPINLPFRGHHYLPKYNVHFMKTVYGGYDELSPDAPSRVTLLVLGLMKICCSINSNLYPLQKLVVAS